jgi:hypothetical protein
MKRLSPALLSLLFLLISCGGGAGALASANYSYGDSQRETVRTRVERTVLIYSAVIRRIVTKDHTFGRGKSPFEHVYVVDGVVKEAGDVRRQGQPRKPFSEEIKLGIREELRDLPPVSFLRDADSVRAGEDGLVKVKGNGVIITLGPISDGDDRVKVGTNLRCSELCGQWSTYVLERDGEVWRVTGTVGPVAIS